MDNARDVSIVLCGEAGQGIQTVEYLLSRILQSAGYHVFSTPEYMSRIRGGANSTEIRVSSQRVRSFVNRMDVMVPFSKTSIPHLAERMSPETVLLGEPENLQGGAEGAKKLEVPFTDIAKEIGNAIYANTVAVGAIAALFEVNTEIIDNYLRHHFSSKGPEIADNNVQAAERGYKLGQQLGQSGEIRLKLEPDAQVSKELIMTGTDAVSLGALAGGCTFLSSYPMSPSTGVLTFLAQYGKPYGVVVEQTEDEIAALNMALGASYAGARAMITTSGGGFALMVEAVSLAGIQEDPVVIHLAQRPGPATGLPTRTEQGDLLFALFAGHGAFPKILLAPGKIEDCFFLTQQAFNLAAKYQTPVILMTDQYVLESSYNFPFGKMRLQPIERHIVRAEEGYLRYKITDSGISPRAIPGYGPGLVAADSHEHTEDGHITEREDVTQQMVDKRLRKLEGIRADCLPPELVGSENYKTLLIGWGSTYYAIVEAMAKLGRDDLALLHFQQVYPLHASITDYLQKAQRTIAIENNATGQLASLIRMETGITIQDRLLKYTGRPFTIEELVSQLQDKLG